MTRNKAKNDQLLNNKPANIIKTNTIADNALTLKTEKLNAMNFSLMKIKNK